MTTVALIIAAVALIAAYLAMRQVGALDRRLSEVNKGLTELRSAMGKVREQSEERLTEMRLELRRKAGEVLFSPTMTIKEALAVHPRVSEVLADFQLASCSNCAVSDVDTIEGACQSYGIDQPALMAALNGLVGGDGDVKPLDVSRRRLNI